MSVRCLVGLSVSQLVGDAFGHAFAFWPSRSDLWPCIRLVDRGSLLLRVTRCVRISIRGLVRRAVGWSVGNAFVIINEKWTLTEKRGTRRRDEEEGWMRRMREGRGGGRKDEEEGATRRVKKHDNYKGLKVGGAGREMEMP